jgi:PAS domain S-box-containing protein
MLRDSSNVSSSKSGPASVEVLTVEEPFRLMVEAAVDYAVFMLDSQGFVSTWNLGAERIKGYQAKEIIGRHFSVFYPVEAIKSRLPEHELAVATAQGRYENEGWRVRKDGSRFWGNVIITALRERDGSVVGFGKVTRDLSERRTAEQAVRESKGGKLDVTSELVSANSSRQNILDASTLLSIIATDMRGIVTIFNRGAELLLGYTAEEIIGKQAPTLFHLADEIESCGLSLSKLLKRPVHGFDVFTNSIGKTSYDQRVWTYVHKDGHPITVILSLSAIREDDGQVVGLLGIAEDVTERQRAAKELASAYAQLSSVMDSTSEGILQISRDWTILYANRKGVESLVEFKIGKVFWNCFPAMCSSHAKQQLRITMEDRLETTHEDYYAPYDQWYRGHAFPTGDGISLFFRNITAEKKLQDQLTLEQLLREKRIEALSHMAGGLAHEINNPLAIIQGRASDLRRLAAGDAPLAASAVRAACDNIVQTSDRAIKILRGLKGFGREAGKDPMEFASIYEIAEQCMELQQARFDSNDIEVRVDLKPDIPLLLCRETQIGQILTNVLNNAFDAIVQSDSAVRWISLTAEQVEDDIRIDITDSGPGIEDHFKAHLMEPFFTTKELGLGMGVGLSLSRAIAQDHGGTLALCKDMEHTCFRLVLPIKGDTADHEEQTSSGVPY